jgi:hypothetical protein
MFSRFKIALGLSLLLALALSVPVLAGGWAVVTLDELPVNVAAGQPLTIGFTVLQHGRTPTPGLKPTVTAALLKDEQFTVKAQEEGKPGHYTATLTFPKGGEWNWSIDAFGMDQPMPVIHVSAPAGVTATQPEKATAGIPFLLIVRALAFGIGILALVFALRSRSRFDMAVTAVCLLVGVGSFMTGSTVPKAEAQSGALPEAAMDSSIFQVELGRRLFIAKGCLACHRNSKADQSDYWTVDMGAPNLSNFSASPEALRLRLKDPSSVNSNTQMPNLNLSDAEIEALIAFINSE